MIHSSRLDIISLRWKKRKRKKVQHFCWHFETIRQPWGIHNDRLKPVRIPILAVKWFDRFYRLLNALHCVRQGCQIFSKCKQKCCTFVWFFPRSDLNIRPIRACHISNKRKLISDWTYSLLFYERINSLISFFALVLLSFC